MDEILIEEKRYVSSKQAAKLTGYAKDYIGQLCREGRVPARLVGRSWYVLESAIQDHRFGAPAISPKEEATEQPEARPSLAASLETPRYEAAPQEELRSIEELAAPKALSEAVEAGDDLQESWRAWFAQSREPEAFEAPMVEDEITSDTQDLSPRTMVETEIAEDTEVNVPIRAIHHSLYQPTADEILPRIVKEEAQAPVSSGEGVQLEERRVHRTSRAHISLKIGSVLVGAIAVIVAILGSGYADAYILANKQISLIAGVSSYNR
jgi:hypothetical protein